MNKKRKARIAWVKWVDSSGEMGPYTPNEMHRGITVETAGVLIDDTGEFISVALDFFELDGTYRDIAHIPKVNIVAKKIFNCSK